MEILKNFEQNVKDYTGAVKSRFIIVNGEQTELDNKVAENQSNIDALDASVKAYEEAHAEVHNELQSAIDASFQGVKADMTKMNSDLRDYVNENNGMQFAALIGMINSSFQEVHSELDDLSAWKTTHNDEYQSLVDSNAEIKDDISTINSSINAIKADQETDYQTLSNVDASIRSEMAAMDSDLRSYINTNNGMQFAALIGRIDSSFQAVHSELDDLSAWKTTHETDYQGLVDADTEIKGDISNINASLATISQDYGVQFAALIGRIDSSFQATYSDISALETSVNDWQSNHETEYQALVTEDASIRAEMAKMDSDLRTYINTNNGMQFAALIGRIDSSFQATYSDISTLETNVNDWQTNHENDYQSLVDAIAEIRQIIEDNELVTAQALVNLDNRLKANKM